MRKLRERRRSRLGPISALITVTTLAPFAAWAQRTEENATAQSDDAFGRRVGNESIGIYNPGAGEVTYRIYLAGVDS